MIETSSVTSRKSSEIFGNLRKMSEKCSETFALPSEKFWNIFGNCSEIFGKWSKTSSLVCLCNKQNITCPLVDMNFSFSCSTRHLTRSLRSLLRYRVEHSKIKFISTRGHVISSIYSCFKKGLTNREKLTRQCRKLLWVMSVFTFPWVNFNMFQRCGRKQHKRVFVHSRSLLLNRLEPQSSKAKLLLPTIPIGIVAYAFTLS